MSLTALAEGSEEIPLCKLDQSNRLVKEAFELQKKNNTLKALEVYQKTLELDENCVDALYEMGWSYWKIGEWKKVVSCWEKALKLSPDHKKIPQFIDSARENLKVVESGIKQNVFRKNISIFSQSLPKDSPVQLTLIQRWQSYNKNPELVSDHYDEDIFSPKSIQFSNDGETVFVHSLEGHKTVLFNKDGSEKKGIIDHKFTTAPMSNLIDKKPPFNYRFSNSTPRHFLGKPVESILTHGGKYLWVTYYRRSYDDLGQDPSAVAVIDTQSSKIKRVMGTGPISKYIERSHNNKWLAISNWGDNTVGIYDIEDEDFNNFKEHQLLVVEKKHPLKHLKSNRDKDCGFCVRGLAFSKDDQYLFVSRMKGGGIAIYEVGKNRKFNYVTTVFGIQPGTRDLHVSNDGAFLYAGCNASGTIAKIPIVELIAFVGNKKLKKIQISKKELSDIHILKQFIGLGVRSFKLHPLLNYIFSTANNGSEIIILKADDLKVLGRVPVDSYPVGLGISPNGKYLWSSSQGKESMGGNSVSIFLVSEYLSQQIILDEGKLNNK